MKSGMLTSKNTYHIKSNYPGWNMEELKKCNLLFLFVSFPSPPIPSPQATVRDLNSLWQFTKLHKRTCAEMNLCNTEIWRFLPYMLTIKKKKKIYIYIELKRKGFVLCMLVGRNSKFSGLSVTWQHSFYVCLVLGSWGNTQQGKTEITHAGVGGWELPTIFSCHYLKRDTELVKTHCL